MARSSHTAWTPPSLPDSIVLLGGLSAEYTAEMVPGNIYNIYIHCDKTKLFSYFFTGGGGFDLSHRTIEACGIPDAGDTIVLTGGWGWGVAHNYVTRWVGAKIQLL